MPLRKESCGRWRNGAGRRVRKRRGVTKAPVLVYVNCAIAARSGNTEYIDAFLSAAENAVLAWLEKRQVAAVAFHDFETMSDRELRDIGLSQPT